MHTMTPWAERWEASIEADLMLDGDELEIEFDFANLMRGDAASRSAYYQSGIQNGWLTRNEARIAENLNPISGLDQPLRPLNMVEEDAAEALESQTAAADGTPSPDADPGSDQAIRQRLRGLVHVNAQRLARRISRTGVIGPKEVNLISETFGLTQSRVEQWAAPFETPNDEHALVQALIELGTHE